MSDAIRTIGKNGVELSEYKGEYGLTVCYEGKDGKFWQQWGKVRTGKDSYSDKDRPVKVILGDKPTAIGVLQTILKELTGFDYVPDHGQGKEEDSPLKTGAYTSAPEVYP